jgi:heptaprenyl diphosphate synthase
VEAIVPLGGYRIGLANIAVLIACHLLSRRMGLLIMAARVLISSILFGSATTFIFSICGGLLAWCVMAVMLPFYGKFSLIGISVLSAAAHNFGQVLAACVTLGSPAPLSMLWWLLLFAIPAGILTGILAEMICHRVKL